MTHIAEAWSNGHLFQINLTLAWLWIVAGFVTGLVLGTNFHREDWLGGYGSFARRLCRLGHISFFGLAMVNLMFFFTGRLLGLAGSAMVVASWGFVIGALTMPLCCFGTAFVPKMRLLFGVPIVSLIVGGLSTVWKVINL